MHDSFVTVVFGTVWSILSRSDRDSSFNILFCTASLTVFSE